MEIIVAWNEDFCADWPKMRLIASTDAGAAWLVACLSGTVATWCVAEADFPDGSKLEFDPWNQEDEVNEFAVQITMPPVMPKEFAPPTLMDFDLAYGDLVVMDPVMLREIVSTMAGWSALVALVGFESVPYAERVDSTMMIETPVCHEYYADGSAILWTPNRPRKGRVRVKT